MKAWRFYGFGDMRLDEVADPVCGAEEVIVEPLCVQPSVTEAQLARHSDVGLRSHQTPARDGGAASAFRP